MKPSRKKPRLSKSRINSHAFLLFLGILFFCLVLSACHPQKRGEVLLPRPQPSYTAWLEKQSMLAQADKLINQVSQSERIWMYSAQRAPVELLLKAAPQWLELSSAQFPGETFLHRLILDFPQFTQAGIKGLYLGPLGEDQSFWQDKGGRAINNRLLSASLELDPRLGETRDLRALEEAAETAGFELGADVLAAVTSMGPDFFLQARHAAGHSGLYAMLELPQPLWPEAPAPQAEWEGVPLTEEQVKLFSSQGILPESLYRDRRAWGVPAGWAITGEIQGTDGNMRRWLYRYEGDAKSPVLLWQDPSGLAARIFSASIIQQTGFWRIPLAGLRLSALMGLEPQANQNVDHDGIAVQKLSPGLEVLNILADQIHRYGGWALQADPIPAELLEKILAGACDFCREDTSEKLLLKAVERENPSELTKLYKHWLEQGLEQKRLARGFNAASAEQLSSATKSQNTSDIPIVLHWRLGLPGLAFLSPSELGLYGSSDSRQNHSSILEREKSLKNLLYLRAEYGLAEGKLIKVLEEEKSTLSMLSALPQKGYWLLSTNFTSLPLHISIPLPQKCQAALDVISRKDLSHALDDNGKKLSLPLGAFETRQVILLPSQ